MGLAYLWFGLWGGYQSGISQASKLMINVKFPERLSACRSFAVGLKVVWFTRGLYLRSLGSPIFWNSHTVWFYNLLRFRMRHFSFEGAVIASLPEGSDLPMWDILTQARRVLPYARTLLLRNL